MPATRRRFAYVIAVTVAAVALAGCSWSFQTVDGNGVVAGRTGADVGASSTAITYNGFLNAFYQVNTGGTQGLRRAVLNGFAWNYSVIDGAGSGVSGHVASAGNSPSAAIIGGVLHVFSEGIDGGVTVLRHAWYTPGVGWHDESLNAGAPLTGAPEAFVQQGVLNVFYGSAGTLENGVYDAVNGTWTWTAVDGPLAAVTGHTSDTVADSGIAAVGVSGDAVLFYADNQTASLRQASRHNGAWSFDVVDGPGSAHPGHSNAALGDRPNAVLLGGALRVFYTAATDADANNIRQATFGFGVWAYSNLDGNATAGGGRSPQVYLASNGIFAFNNGLHLFYRDLTGNALREASLAPASATWTFTEFGGNGWIGTNFAVSTVLFSGHPEVFYYDGRASTQNLRLATFG
jgi:hypothetical protein